MDVVIAVTGATGQLGSRVARALSARGLRQRLVVRDPARAPALDGGEVAQAEYADAEAMRRALEGVRVLYLVSGSEARNRLEQHRTAIDAAAAAGVERVVYTSFLGAAADATFTFARDHFHTERHLHARGLATVALRNSMYLDILPSFAADGVIRGPAGEGRFAPVARDDVAAVSVAALLDDSHTSATYEVTGPELVTMADVAAIMSETTGRPVRYRAETVEEAFASRASYGAAQWEVTGWVTSYLAIATGEMEVVTDVVERLTGRPAIGVREYLQQQT